MEVRGILPNETVLIKKMLNGLQERGWQEQKRPTIIDRLINADINQTKEVIRPTIAETNDEPITPEQQDKIKSGVFDMDKLLGEYFPQAQLKVIEGFSPQKQQPEIKLYNKCIEAVAIELSVDMEELKVVVLLHEFAHWITHKLPYEEQKEWNNYTGDSDNHDVHEGWAQLITWWVVKDMPKLKDVFCKLNEKQSPPYKVWKQFEISSVKELLLLRELNASNATKEDWRTFNDKIKECPNSTYEELKLKLKGYLLGKELDIV